MNRTITTVGVVGVVMGSIGIFTAWAAFGFSCSSPNTCDQTYLVTTAVTAWVGLLVGVITVVVRTRSLTGPWFLQIVAIIITVNLVMIAANLAHTS